MTDFSQNYLQLRDTLILKVEGYKPRIYLDTNGIPTVGTGLALVTLQNKTWSVRADRIDFLEKSAGYVFSDAEMNLLHKIAEIIDEGDLPNYFGQRKTASNFLATDLGKQLDAILDLGVNGDSWAISELGGFSLSSEQAKSALSLMMTAEYESQVNFLLRKAGVDPASISENERAVYASMVYQRWSPDIGGIAKLIRSGANEKQIYERIKLLSGGYATRALDEFRVLIGDPGAGVVFDKSGAFILERSDKSGGILIRSDGSRVEYDPSGSDTSTGQLVIDPTLRQKVLRQMRMRAELDMGLDATQLADAFAEEVVPRSSTYLADGSVDINDPLYDAWQAAEKRQQLVDAWKEALAGKDLEGAEVVVTERGSAVVLKDGTWIEVGDADAAIDITTIEVAQPSNGFQTLFNTISNTAPTLIDALQLLSAIQSGEPLPILDSGLHFIDNRINVAGQPVSDYSLSGVTNAVSGLSALLSLDAALERGDTLGAITSGVQAVSYGVTAYSEFLIAANGGDAIGTVINNPDVFSAASTLGKALPYLNLVNSIANGNTTGAAIAGLQILATEGIITGTAAYAIPYIGWAYAIYSLVDGLFGGDDIPDPWGSGQFTWEGNAISWRAVGETGGDQAVSAVMQQTLATMNALLEQVREQNPGSTLGLIPQRMPGLGYDMSGYHYSDINPLSGAEQHPELRFDTSGNPYNAQPGSPESFQSLVEAMVRSALARGAIAPEWEVRTAQMQTAAGDPKAGLTEEERAGRDGQLAAPITGDTQTWRPVVLDLDGDGIETSAQADGVAFDVDDSGYLKATGWVKGDDAMLVLDRNLNGQFDSARELFSNAQVALGRRGLAGMAWVDANYDGKLTDSDPVWNELKLWRDLDQNGVQGEGEVQSLNDLGVTELNYTMGTFTRNGVQQQLASPDLQADKDGTRVSVVDEGILIQTSADGKLSLLVTRIDDKTAVEAGRDGVTGYEDVEIIVNPADLLTNDTLGGFLGRDLTLTGLTNFRHGTGFIDANGLVHFMPEANYDGADAGFDYAVRASNGQEGTATVDVTLQGVNDAPTLAGVDHTTRAVYGYTPLKYQQDETGTFYQSGGTPIYAPYEGHTTPIAYEDTGAGQVNGTDVDDPASSLQYEVVGKPQYGTVTVNADGTFQYTSWKSPNTPSDHIVVNGQYAGLKDGTLYTQADLPGSAVYPTTDVFQVRITDPQGASTIQSISVPHYGPYLPPTPAGGGGKKPIAVDLNGDGFEFINLDDSNVFFDMNGDGWRRRTSWVGANDGLLVYDANGDGKIDKAEEISFVGYKEGAQTDLAGLAAFDTNGDGVFNAQDEQWQRFGVWQDANSNGVTDAGELHTLAELGVESVSLTSDGRFEVVNGQTVHGVGSMALADGGTLALADVTLAFSNEVLTRLANGETTTQIKDMFSPAGEEINGTSGNDLILGKNGSNIIYALAGDDVIFEDGGNDIIDGGEGNDLIYAGADNDLALGGNGDDTIYAGLGNDVVFGGDGHDALFGEGGNDVIFGGAGNDLISGGWGNDVLTGNEGDDLLFGETGNDALFGGTGNDELHGMEGHDYLNGGEGNDYLDGGTGDDQMLGGAGDDVYVVDSAADAVTELADEGVDTVRTAVDGLTLGANVENLTLLGDADLSGYGNELDNVLTGNQGNNLLAGGTGNDDYHFTLGDGHDTIEDHDATAGNVDTLHLHGITQSDVMLSIDGDDLLLNIHANGNSDGGSVRIRNGAQYNPSQPGSDGTTSTWSVERVQFDDGTVWQMPELWKRIIIGGPGNETFQGSDDSETFYAMGGDDLVLAGGGHDSLYGGEGNDRLYGEAGDDVLDGGSNSWGGGDDQLEGGTGSDTYRYGIGQGNDVISDNDTSTSNASSADVLELGTGFTADNTRVMRQGDDLVLTTTDYSQWLRVRNHYSADGSGQIEAIRFSNGQEWNATDLSTVDWRPTLAQGEGVVQGSYLNELIQGGATNDVIDASSGDDVVRAGAGDDHVILGTGNDLGRGEAGNDLIEGNDGDDELHGDDGNDVLLGGSGNDRLYGEAGDDVLDGGSNTWGGGDDYLEGGTSSDTYRYGIGQGNDVISDNDTSTGNASSTDVLELGAGFTQDNTRVMRQGDDLVLTTTDYSQWLRVRNHYSADGSGQIEAIRFSNGQEWNATDLSTVDWRPTLAQGEGVVQGSYLNELIQGGATNDVIDASSGDDVVRAGAGDDVLLGGWGNDTLDGQEGADWLRGGDGDDQLSDLSGNNIAEAGTGNDTIVLGNGDDVAIGGTGYDNIHLGAGPDLILFNQGDGTDQIFSDDNGGADNALSLGGGVRYADLGLSRSGSDLVLDIANSDRIVLHDWYGASGPSVGTLQVVIGGSAEYQPDGGDPLHDQAVEQFDFTQLVAAFDQDQLQNPGSRWSVMNSLLDAHLQGSDSVALGGELAMTYAREGSLVGTTSTAANEVLGTGQLGTTNMNVGSSLNTSVHSYRAA
jgi:Ca2+-binding RTX toxin-like protein